MKHKKQRISLTKLWTFCLGSLCLGACSSTSIEGEEAWTEAEKAPIAFGADLSRAAVNTGSDGKLTGMQDYAVWGWNGYQSDGTLPSEGTEVSVFDNTTVNQATGTYEGTRYWEMGKTYRFFAVHPAGLETTQEGIASSSVSCTAVGTLIVPNFDTSKTGQEAVDLMVSKSEVVTVGSQAPSKVNLAFAHALAKVQVQVTNQGKPLTNLSVKLSGIPSKGSVSYTFNETAWTPSWTKLSYVTDKDTPFKRTDILSVATQGKVNVFDDMLLIPHELGKEAKVAKVALQYNYDGESEIQSKEISLKTDVLYWEAGKSYKYDLTIAPHTVDNITLNVTIEAWTSKDVSVEW